MDKNTITGMLLMCAVIFGFMWLNTPDEAQLAEQRRLQDSIAAAEAAADAKLASGAIKDTLTASDRDALAAVLRDMSAADSAATPVIKNEGVSLRLADGKVVGTIALQDTVINYADLEAGRVTDARLNNLAVAAINRARDVYVAGGDFASNLNGSEQLLTLENDSVAVTFNTHGGMIASAVLKAYKDLDGKPLELFGKADNQLSFTLANNTQRFKTSDFYFTPEQESDTTLVMKLNMSGGASWAVRYTLVPGTYMVRMDIVQQGMEHIIPTNMTSIDLNWTQRLRRHEQGRMFEERNSAIYFKSAGGGVSNLSESGNDDDETRDNVKWMAAKNQFFSTVLIADSVMLGGKFESHSLEKGEPGYDRYLKLMTFSTMVPYNSTVATPASFYLFVGPNRYPLLSSYDRFSSDEDLNLTRLISLGWALFRWINTWIIIPVFTWLGKFSTSYGIIILLLTIIIKLVLSPLTFKSYMSQAKMRVLAPDVAAINEKYPGDENAMKRQQETMKLYSLAGSSPFGGCLPMLLQMPILIAMFTFFPSSIELRGQSFLWASDLSAPDKIFEWSANIPIISSFFGNHISLFCLLMTVTNIVYTYLSMQSQQNSMPGMKWMMYLMPIMFLVFFNNYASGLSYYYFISLLITIMQTYLCRALVSEKEVRATIAANLANPKRENEGCMGKMAKLQQEQQAALREQERRNAGRSSRRRR